MKKRYRFAAAILCWSLVFCSCWSPVTSAEDDISEKISSYPTIISLRDLNEGDYDGPCEGTLEGGFSWTYDQPTQTLTIRGEGVFPISIFDIFFYEAKKDNLLNTIESVRKFVDPWNSVDYPKRAGIKTLRIEDGITDCSSTLMDRTLTDLNVLCGIDRAERIETLILGKDFKSMPVIATVSYQIDPGNPYYSSYNGALYTKDYKKLIQCPEEASSQFHPNLEIIGQGALVDVVFRPGWTQPDSLHYSPLVIPWGVTTMEEHVFGRYDMWSVIIPDTLIHIDEYANGSWYGTEFFDSRFHHSRLEKMYGAEKIPCKSVISADKVETRDPQLTEKQFYSYYGVTPNSLKTFQNGKTYYFGPNYEYAKGWKQVSGNWYYFNDYGAAVVKIWLKSGNKWYFMQADGTMATNKWVEWYKKWYYVGADGAMYANRKTPDGYWVNGSGVWVK